MLSDVSVHRLLPKIRLTDYQKSVSVDYYNSGSIDNVTTTRTHRLCYHRSGSIDCYSKQKKSDEDAYASACSDSSSSLIELTAKSDCTDECAVASFIHQDP